MAKLLEVHNLVKSYQSINEVLHILRGINFDINPGEIVAISGESGSGKSTFLNMIGGLDSVSAGTIKIEGINITNFTEDEMTDFRSYKIGFIFQSHYLLDEFNAIENVMIPFLMNKYNKKEAYEKSEELLLLMGLKNRIKHFPSQLSGGEKQRVAIARAFINNPSLILADEPTGNLDEKNAHAVLEMLFNVISNREHSLIIVTHSKQLVMMTENKYLLENGILNKI